jgi:hypothetical protein
MAKMYAVVEFASDGVAGRGLTGLPVRRIEMIRLVS